jgi:hypothetical protein
MASAEPRLQRILLALDAAGPVPAAQASAIGLAARFEAEIQALLLQEMELTRAAALPFATEVSLLAGLERPMSARAMNRSLQNLTARVQAMIMEMAAPSTIRWSMHARAGGAGGAGLLAELGEGSLLVLGHGAHYMPDVPAPLDRRSPPGNGTCVIHDDSPAGRFALALAALLDPHALSMAAGRMARPEQLVERLASVRPRTLVMPASLYGEYVQVLMPVLRRLECTLLVVGGE